MIQIDNMNHYTVSNVHSSIQMQLKYNTKIKTEENQEKNFLEISVVYLLFLENFV